jgi:hypothetical protein
LREVHADSNAATFRCQWDGASPDYGAMVQLLG